MLRMRAVSFTYAGASQAALSDVSLQLPDSCLCGVVGAAGAGKSTFCYALSGFVPHFYRGRLEGTVWLDQVSSEQTPLAEWLERVGLVLQNPFAQLSGSRFTVFEETACSLENAAVPPQEIRARVTEALDLVGLSSLSDRSPYALSGGQQQLLAIASMLVLRPRLLVLDEPTAQLDPRASRRVFEILRQVRDQGTTVVVTEHNTALLAEFADRIVHLAGGRLREDGAPRQVFCERAADLQQAGVPLPAPTDLALWLQQSDAWPAQPLPLDCEELATALAARYRFHYVQTAHAHNENGSQTVVEVEGLHFSYGATPVLRGVSLRVAAGERVALVGHNGAGKTTLARHLVGLLQPRSGTVRVGEGGVAYLFQNPDNQLFCGTVWEEVAFGPRCQGQSAARLAEQVEWALGVTGLRERSQDNPRDLDPPLRKRLALASILSMDTAVLVLDEPTSNLDANEMRLLVDILDMLSGRGKTLIAVTHEMDFCAEHFPRVVAFADGCVVADGPASSVLADDEVRKKAGLQWPATVDTGFRMNPQAAVAERPATRQAFRKAISS